MKKLLLGLFSLLSLTSAYAQSTNDYKKYEAVIDSAKTMSDAMKGNIGPYKITMHLTKIGDYDGFYYYDDYPKNVFRLKFVQSWDEDSNGLTWFEEKRMFDEYTRKGNKSGTFEGTYYNRAGCGSSFEGKFTNSKGEVFEFSVIYGSTGWGGDF